ncbi:hypothetical protein [Actibacterium sp. MT2.3-13A]|uniref:hypothetical protein n=1 Tax=Actibacterium sp. MT2.3-13A TaxID=2828332 RepID=UPI001BAD83A3|nr:hypothetical protein [Actibacterium sp. MT2.3-13A]
MYPSRKSKALAVAALLLLSPGGAAAAGCTNGVLCNQDYVESVSAAPGFAIDDVMAVFGHVFASLPDRVRVYPTENYFYFTFGHDGLTYAGNMRLDVKDRDEGILHFAYFNQMEDWNADLLTRYRPLSADDGVEVEKVEELLYKVSYAGKSALFALNDLRGVRPPEALIGEGEEYLGPVFDESGLQFYLMFHRADARFMFVLNETAPKAEELLSYSDGDPSILIGMRTGFSFYQDRYLDRKILIGVYAGNVENNNYFDGPFDQLPDNFLQGDALRDAILAKHPDLEGEIDRFGNFREHEGRFLVNPYINYSYLSELEEYRRCGDAGLTRFAYYQCLQPPEVQ